MSVPRSVLFTGHAPVHYLCFRPIHRRLEALPGVKVFVSGGFRHAVESGYRYDPFGLYRAFDLPDASILPVEEASARRFDLLLSANKTFVTPLHNAQTSIQIFHGVSFRNMAVRPENLAYDFFFTTGPYMERKFVTTGLLDDGDPRVVSVGFPKTDALLDGSLKRRAIREQLGLNQDRPLLLYAPTGQRRNSLETFGPALLKLLEQSGRYDVVVKVHDHPKNGLETQLERLGGIGPGTILVVDDFDVIPLLFAADLLITDASSVSNEFSLLDRPIVFLDVPELIAEAEARGAHVDLETWGRRGGVTARTPSEALEAIEGSLSAPDQFSAIRRAMASDLFHNPGRAGDAAVEWCTKHLSAQTAT